MEMPLSSELGWDLFLRVWTEPGHRPPRPTAGSTKAEPEVLGTALGSMRGLCTWLLGSGKRSILLTRVEWKEVAQSRGSALKAPASLTLPPILAPIPREGRAGSLGDSLELLAPPAHWSVSQWVGGCVGGCVGSRRLGSGRYWVIPAWPGPRLTAAYALPAGVAGRGRRCARS